MQARGVAVERNRRRFRFRRCSYTPDSYSPQEQQFYEVIGSRQRYYQLLPKLDLMDCLYPEIRLALVNPDGTPYRPHPRWISSYAAEVHARLSKCGMTMTQLAEQLGVATSTLSNFLCGHSQSRVVNRRLRQWLSEVPDDGPIPSGMREEWAREESARVAARVKMSEVRLALASRLRERIAAHGMVRAGIARGLGVHPQVINDALQSGRSLRILQSIEAYLNEANGHAYEDLRCRDGRRPPLVTPTLTTGNGST